MNALVGSERATSLTPQQEMMFRAWWEKTSKALGLDPDPDNPLHFYDYRGAWLTGKWPEKKGEHWDSRHKTDNHPNRLIPFNGGVLDTKYEIMVPMNEYLNRETR